MKDIDLLEEGMTRASGIRVRGRRSGKTQGFCDSYPQTV